MARIHACKTLALWLAGGSLLPLAAQAADTRVIPWKFEQVPYWEQRDGQGQFGGYSDGRFEIVVTGDAVSIRNIHFGAPLGLDFPTASSGTDWDSPDGYWRAEANGGGFDVVYKGPADYCDPFIGCIPQYTGGLGLQVAGDLTRSSARLQVIGGGFNHTDVHHNWWYGHFAHSGYVVQVPEPSIAWLLAAGLSALLLAGSRRQVAALHHDA